MATANREKVYVATAQAFDLEMETKIARHRADRGALWRTIEAPLDLNDALSDLWDNEIVLIDCLTMWLANHLEAGNTVAEETDRLIATLSSLKTPVILVSNEVGAGGISDNALARKFEAEQGRLNQRIAKHADLVVAVMAGLPLALKGTIPENIT